MRGVELLRTIVLNMLLSSPQNHHIQTDKYFRHGNACFRGLDCTAYDKQRMTQISFMMNTETKTKHMYQVTISPSSSCNSFVPRSFSKVYSDRPSVLMARVSGFRKEVFEDTTEKFHMHVSEVWIAQLTTDSP